MIEHNPETFRANPEQTIVIPNSDANGDFTGALMPMDRPLDTNNQWQGLLDGLVSHVVSGEPDVDIEGLYAFTWWSDAVIEDHKGMLLTRLSRGYVDSKSLEIDFSENIMGLMSICRDEFGNYTTVLALLGYATSAGKVRPNRILASTISAEGEIEVEHDMALVDSHGKNMISALDKSLEERLA
jgi:hypothetical protein